MGRQLYRVPMGFDWPLNRIWEGYQTTGNEDGWEPPTGDGYQLWETTSEGSPITPVFATLAELCEYAAENCTVFGPQRASAEDWRRMLDADFVSYEMTLRLGGKLSKIVFI